MIARIVTSLVTTFIILGALISAATAIGIIRLKDAYSRGHTADKSATLGAIFLLFEMFLYLIRAEGYVSMRLIFGIIFTPVTDPLSSHLMMKASYNNKTPYTKDTKTGGLKDKFNNKEI